MVCVKCGRWAYQGEWVSSRTTSLRRRQYGYADPNDTSLYWFIFCKPHCELDAVWQHSFLEEEEVLVPHGPWRLCCLCWQPVGDDIESHGVAVGDCIVCDWPIHWECAKELPGNCGRRNRLEESDDARSASDRPSPLQKTE